MASKGVLYVATSNQYLTEARRSARRAADILDLPTAIVTHEECAYPEFDHVIVDDSPTDSFADKPRNLLKSPFEQTLYLDTDTYVVEPLPQIFDVLQSSPIALCVDPFEGDLYNDNIQKNPAVPRSFPEFQTGVIVYEQTPNVEELVTDWMMNQSPATYPDQLSFRETLFESEVQPTPLPPRYNALVGTSVYGPVKVLHDNNRFLSTLDTSELDSFLATVNSSSRHRILYNSFLEFVPFNPRSLPVAFKIGLKVMREGYEDRIKTAVGLQ